jgi:GntR family transcriptional repressor for pyruvate dehydrogenase complex
VTPDLDFHRSIAEATGNRHFRHLFNYLGALLIPRARVETFKLNATAPQDYLRRVNREHEKIYRAIERQDATASRTAMRAHLGNSRDRLRRAFAQRPVR